MSEPTYHLVFRGEILDGQDPAAVRQRVAALLKMDGARAAALFTGKPVVLKKSAPKEVAAKFQGAFKKAGARLRVMPVQESASAEATPEPAAAARPEAAPGAEAPERKLSLAERLASEAEAKEAQAAANEDAQGRPSALGVPDDAPGANAFELSAADGDLLADDEKSQVVAVEVDTSHIHAAAVGEGSFEDDVEKLPPPPPPDTSGIELDDSGDDLTPAREFVEAEIDLSGISLAEPGADLEPIQEPPPMPPPDVEFDVSEVGADMVTEAKPPPPPPPDTSHLSLES